MSQIETILAIRGVQYGDAQDNFTKIGRIWGALLDIDDIPAYQVALMMDALKTSRLFNNATHEDSWIDKQGYTELGRKIANHEPR